MIDVDIPTLEVDAEFGQAGEDRWMVPVIRWGAQEVWRGSRVRVGDVVNKQVISDRWNAEYAAKWVAREHLIWTLQKVFSQ